MARFSDLWMFFLVLSFSNFVLADTKHNAAENKKDTVPVSVQTVLFEDMAPTIVASGIVRPVSEQSLSFKVPGIIEKVMVYEGEFVTKGQPLATLILEEFDANVAKAEAVLADAIRQKDRINTLSNQNLASAQNRQQTETSLQIAEADLRIARFNRKYAVVSAPSDGRILTRNIEPNELVQAGQQAFVFADQQQGWSVRLSVADVDVIQLQLHDTAKIRLDAFPDQVFNGAIREISGRSDMRSQTFEVDIVFNSVGLPALYSGLIAHAEILSSKTQKAMRIPLTAFVRANGRQGELYVLDGQDNVHLKKVAIRYLKQDYALVPSGLNDGDQVIIEGGSFIVPGSAVSVKKHFDISHNLLP